MTTIDFANRAEKHSAFWAPKVTVRGWVSWVWTPWNSEIVLMMAALCVWQFVACSILFIVSKTQYKVSNGKSFVDLMVKIMGITEVGCSKCYQECFPGVPVNAFGFSVHTIWIMAPDHLCEHIMSVLWHLYHLICSSLRHCERRLSGKLVFISNPLIFKNFVRTFLHNK